MTIGRTPKPWKAYNNDEEGIHILGGPDEDIIVCEQIHTDEDAGLLVAAPDLLEGAKLALEVAESWIHSELDGTSLVEGALQKLAPVRAAIKKAG